MSGNMFKIDILPNQFLKSDGTFDQDEAILLSGKIAGICYSKKDFDALLEEPIERTKRRINLTLGNHHLSVYDHVYLSLNLQNIPKMLAMILNNEHQYTTSEKSLRYTPVERKENSYITEKEEKLYHKWVDIFKVKIKAEYPDRFSDSKIEKLAQENARYLVTVFTPTNMIYTTSLKQINYLSYLMLEYIENSQLNDEFDYHLGSSMLQFVQELHNKNILVDGLMTNDKNRKISLFGHNLEEKEEYFGDFYSTTYLGSYAQFAQAQRHRTLSYQLERLEDKKYYVPPILEDDPVLVDLWLEDMESVAACYPQGELVQIHEMGSYDNFILKCKERLCSAAQLEICNQTQETLEKYQESLTNRNHPFADDIKQYTHGARCSFPDYTCTEDCHFPEGKRLVRKI